MKTTPPASAAAATSTTKPTGLLGRLKALLMSSASPLPSSPLSTAELELRAARLRARLEPIVAGHARAAWRPVTEAGSETRTWFGGQPLAGENSSWPDCNVCSAPLTFLLQLDASDLPGEINRGKRAGILQFFYCTENDCAAHGPDSGYTFRWLRPESTRLLHSGGSRQLPRAVVSRWEAFLDSPSAAELDALGLVQVFEGDKFTLHFELHRFVEHGLPRQLQDYESWVSLAAWGDKLGGWPSWIQEKELHTCGQCGRELSLLIQIDSNDHVKFEFGDGGCGWVLWCADCPDSERFSWSCT